MAAFSAKPVMKSTFKVRADAARRVRNLPPVQAAGQADVGDQKIEPAAALKDSQTGRSVFSFDHPVADLAEDFGDDHSDRGFIIDDQHGLAGPAIDRQLFRPLFVRDVAHEAREIQTHRRALSAFGIDAHLSAGLAHEAVDHGQAKTGSLSQGFCREKRIEDLFDDVGRHTGSGVADAERDVLSRRKVALLGGPVVQPLVGGFDRDASAIRNHRIAGVDAEVEDGVLQLRGIEFRAPKAAGLDDLDVDVGADRPPQQVGHSRDRAVHIDDLGIERLAPGESQQALRQGSGASSGLLGDVDVAANTFEAAL
jgi:hypothetical protein